MILIILLSIIIIITGILIAIKLTIINKELEKDGLQNFPINEAYLNQTISKVTEKYYISKIIEDHPDYSEKSIRNQLHEFSDQIIYGNSSSHFSNNVLFKIKKDRILKKLQYYSFRKTTLVSYLNNIFSAAVTYECNNSAYDILIDCSFHGNNIVIDRYQVFNI